jgi:cyclopropane-fatty-acyl-phospholipid synthase
MNNSEKTVRKLLDATDIEINGSRDFDIRIHDPQFYDRLLGGGVIAFGESYMDGLWDCEALDVLVDKVIRADLEDKVNPASMILPLIWAKIVNRQRPARAFDIGKHHYDIGNDLYQIMLDKRMTYTCGYWKDADDLDSAQEAKLDLICRKIGLQPGMRVLDIGCGWGSFARFAAEKYQANVVGITVSQEQIDLGRKMCAGLDVELRYQDYRDVTEKFDRIVSVGMFEHVGIKNYRTYMKMAETCLTEDGIFLLHTIGTNNRKTSTDAWTDKYIFPGGELPVPRQIMAASEGLFSLEDWHNFRPYYDRTLMAWMKNVDDNIEAIRELGYDDRFYRMWRFFLHSSAGSFRSGRSQLWQLVFTKRTFEKDYQSIR